MKLVYRALEEAVGRWSEKSEFCNSIGARDLEEMITCYLDLTGQTLGKPTRAVRANSPDVTRILRRPDVERMTGLPRSTLYDKVAKGEFPRPIKLGAKAVGWRESVVNDWIDSLTTSSGLYQQPPAK